MNEIMQPTPSNGYTVPHDGNRVDGMQIFASGQTSTFESTITRRIFISHKDKDKEAAEVIRKELSFYGARNLEIFVSERISAGIPWAQEIWTNLENASWLLLLYTDPTEEWDWCLFEAGFFAGHSKGNWSRLVCLHTPEVPPPDPVQTWQSVPVTDGTKLEDFLKELFSGINPELIDSPKRLQYLADQIAGALRQTVRRKLETQWVTRFLTLSMDVAQVEALNKTGRVPAGALCGRKQGESIEIFGHGAGECTMAKLETGLEQHFKEGWLTAFGESLRAASLNKMPIPRIPVLYSPSTQKEYHVVQHCVDRYSDGSLDFCLLFIEKIPENEAEQGRELRQLGDMLRLGRQFRWRILTKFKREISILLQRNDLKGDIEGCLERLRSSMNWVVGESHRLDVMTADDIIDAFESEEDRREMDHDMRITWPKLFEDLERGMESSNLTQVLDALNGMLQANKDYMVRAADRYRELLDRLL
jgi:hypothetical protein